mmetsp:Transcript_6389/g.18996  ORF Transcript_6389/g.18996 Transcript_6389/m.18996 type:complete len:216 (-) Transcript_6389:115-762(-)
MPRRWRALCCTWVCLAVATSPCASSVHLVSPRRPGRRRCWSCRRASTPPSSPTASRGSLATSWTRRAGPCRPRSPSTPSSSSPAATSQVTRVRHGRQRRPRTRRPLAIALAQVSGGATFGVGEAAGAGVVPVPAGPSDLHVVAAARTPPEPSDDAGDPDEDSVPSSPGMPRSDEDSVATSQEDQRAESADNDDMEQILLQQQSLRRPGAAAGQQG